MAGRRVLITGVANAFGARLARRLADDAGVERVVGVDTRAVDPDLAERIDVVQADLRSPDLPPAVRAAAVDTVVHNDIVQFPEPGRPRATLHDVNVIGTLQLLTMCDGLPTLRAIVVRGSASIYGSEPGAPAFFTEEDADRFPLRTRFQRDVGELERLVGAFARRHPAVTCTVLRLQPVVGRDLDTPVNRLVRAPVVPTVLGYDPRVQLLDADDAIGALRRAVLHPVRGAVNVAADGVVSLSRALRHAHRPGAADRRAAVGPAGGRGAQRGRPARAPGRDRALPALRSRRGHHPHAPRAGLPPRATRRSRPLERAAAMTEDDWGFDADFARTAAPLLDALYTTWWRVRADGLEHVPATGPALVVANQAGGQPWDAAMLATALRRHDVRPDDPARFLVHGRPFELPFASTALRRLGGVPAAAGNAERLLAEGHLVLSFPEGGRGTGPGYARRYRLERLGHGGFVELALRSGAPIVPCAIVAGGPGLADRVWPASRACRARRCRCPCRRRPRAGGSPSASRCPVAQHGPDAAEDRALVLELSEEVLARVQEKVYDSLVNREGAL